MSPTCFWFYGGPMRLHMTSGPLDEPARERGGADHDVPYTWGLKPRAAWTAPFTTWQFARLLMLRGKVEDGLLLGDTEPYESA